MIVMYDTVPEGISSIPGDAQAVAGYVDGFYVSFPGLVQRFASSAHCLSIAVHPDADAACCDCESGDLTVAQVAPWVDRQLSLGHWRPCVYASQDTFENQGLLQALAGYGDKIRRWVAAYPGTGQNVPGGYDAHQYVDHGPQGQNYDISICLDTFFPGTPSPPPDQFHYDWFATGPFPTTQWGPLDERQVVLDYDGARKHRIKYHGYLHGTLRPQLAWLAGRVYHEATSQPDKDGKPSWDLFFRGWRFQELIQRSQGKRFA